MVLICLMSLVFFQAHLYEVFLRSHLVLALVVMVSLWRHLHVRQKAARWLLATGLGLWGLLSIILFLMNMARNIRVRGPWLAQTTVTESDGLYRLEVTVPRAWDVRAGQFVYLRIPRVGFWAFLQSHPFTICWSEHLPEGGMRLFMLMEPRHGFTRRLAGHSGYSLMTWVDGPYGRNHHNFGEYGTVVMIATGVGIATQLLHLRELSCGQSNFEVRTRRILVLWMFEKEGMLSVPRQVDM
jgi:predicted ferric reductase